LVLRHLDCGTCLRFKQADFSGVGQIIATMCSEHYWSRHGQNSLAKEDGASLNQWIAVAVR
jgi:hypothetical protein